MTSILHFDPVEDLSANNSFFLNRNVGIMSTQQSDGFA